MNTNARAPAALLAGTPDRRPVLILIADDAPAHFVFDALLGASRELGFAGLFSTLIPVSASRPLDGPALASMDPAGILLLALPGLPDQQTTLRGLQIPCVQTWSAVDVADSAITPDNVLGGRMAARHLAARKYSKVACISGDSVWEAERRTGFLAEASTLGMEVAADVVQSGLNTLQDGRQAFLRLLTTYTLFDAVFCCGDHSTAATVSEAHNRELVVPQDLAILGFSDNGDAAQWVPGLSTVGVDAERLGGLAGRLLLDRMAGRREAGQRDLVPPELTAGISS
ncbi:substrate-binding domain-containing protein [Achromobacter insuavis]|uniref:substrate-binding domain-containing protein n=1 Tax=Achromobacter insuavis TaxID=1287735 RepID=UPI001F138821|nr:substrate-binding domain-containing protein [Achromobacter insuavis]